MKPIYFLSILGILICSCKNNWKYQLNHPDLESKMSSRIMNVLHEDWILERFDNSITISFCRSCGEKDSTDKSIMPDYFMRLENFRLKGPDSVAFITTVNPIMYPTDEDLKRERKPKGILQIKIQFEKPWSEEKYDLTKAKNDTLIEAFKRKGQSVYLKSICGDLRASIPDSSQWGKYLVEYDYYFERMPYHSYLTDKDIFIDGDLPGSWTSPFYVDRNDAYYYKNTKNYLQEFYRRSMFQIGYALGIADYQSPL